MKPIIEIWCLPKELIEDGLREIHKSVVEAVESVGELGLIGEESMVVIFPPMMDCDLGTNIVNIVIEGYGFPVPKGLTKDKEKALWVRLAFKIFKALKKFYPDAFIQCSVGGPDGPYKGYWSSED